MKDDRDESMYAKFLRAVGLGEKSEALNHGDNIIKAKEQIRRRRFIKMRESGDREEVYKHASIACIAFGTLVASQRMLSAKQRVVPELTCLERKSSESIGIDTMQYGWYLATIST